ncbi:MAG: lysostaphin resistance A-like protein [Phycisphaerales bacterium]
MIVVGGFLGFRSLTAGAEGAADPEAADDIAEVMMRLQGGYAVGAVELIPQSGSGAQMLAQLRPTLEMGSPRQRMRFAILAADLAGPAEGQGVLDRLAALVPESVSVEVLEPSDARAFALLEDVFAAMDGQTGPGLTVDDRTFLADHLGWFGELGAGLHPGTDSAVRADVVADAKQTTIGVFVVFIAMAIVAIIGLVLLVLALALNLTGRLRSTRTVRPDLHGILAETFAVWLPLFLGLQLVGGIGLMLVTQPEPPTTRQAMGVALAGFWGSLAALAWPLMRGLSWRNLLGSMGMHRGRGVLREIGAGIIAWMAAIPMLGVGLALTFMLMVLMGLAGSAVASDPLAPAVGPAHPIIGELASGDPVLIVLILLLGAVSAPVIEELFFRGCLFAHLRDAAHRWSPWLAVAMSALVSSFVFAVIHPQGLVAVPALSSLAIAFCLAREWRGSLIAPMVMHAINNGLVLGGVVLLLG